MNENNLKIIKALVSFGSVISIAFGVWHFFVPSIWDWYSYIEETATELVIAVRAINIFFSLLLVLIGLTNLAFVFRKKYDKYSLTIILWVSLILWATRLVLQIIYPQGSENPLIQYSMLITFSVVFLCFLISVLLNTKLKKIQTALT